jgi:hypothetical protein
VPAACRPASGTAPRPLAAALLTLRGGGGLPHDLINLQVGHDFVATPATPTLRRRLPPLRAAGGSALGPLLLAQALVIILQQQPQQQLADQI